MISLHSHCSMIPKRAFALTVILTLASAMAANAAMLNTVDALPCPVPDSDRLVLLHATGAEVESEANIAPADFLDLQQESSIFLGLAAFRMNESKLTGLGDVRIVTAASLSTNFFNVLGVMPVLGRSFLSDEALSGHDAVAMLSYELWQQRFNSVPAILGESIKLDGRSRIIIGILPKNFCPAVAADIWTPMVLTPQMKAERNAQTVQGAPFQVLGRLRPEISLNRAEADVQAFALHLKQQFPDTHRNRSLTLVQLGQGTPFQRPHF